MDNFTKTFTDFLPLVIFSLVIFSLGVVMWIFIVRWERKMNLYIDNSIPIEDVPDVRLQRISDDETLNAFGYGMQMMEDEDGIFVRDSDGHPAYVVPLENLTMADLDLFMDRKELAEDDPSWSEDDPSWNSITRMYDEIDRG